MKHNFIIWMMICHGIIAFTKCYAQDDSTKFNNVFEIPKNHYYISDYMPADYRICYGNWKAVSTSGGYSGSGFTLDFDHLTLKPNGIFAVNRNDTLIAFGKMVLEKKGEMVNCKFIFDSKTKLELANDYEKYMRLIHKDTLILVAPCCDRYNIKLAREKN